VLLPGHIARELNPLLASAALVGLAALIRRRWRGAMLFLLIVAGHLYLYVKDWSKAFGYIPIYLLAALLGVVGLAWLWQAVRRWWPLGEEKAAVVPAMLALLMAAWGLGLNWERCDRRSHDLAQRHGAAILASLPVNAILVGQQDHLAYNVFYQQLIERQRPDVQFVHRAWLGYADELARRFPEWRLADYEPEAPLAAERMLLANDRGGGVYWDYGWEDRAWIEPSHLVPHGLVFRLRAGAWDGAAPSVDQELWRDRFWAIATSPLVAPRGYDWTAQEVYARAFHLRAKLHADAERWALAEAEETTALSLRPDFAETHAFLGLIRLAQQRPAEAANALDRAVALDSYCGLCRAARGRLWQATRPADALAEYEAAVRLRAADVDVLTSIAQLHLQSRRPRPALAALAQIRVEALSKRQTAAVETLYAAAYQALGDCARATEHLRRLQAVAPDHPAIREIGAACGQP
jgi:tetratricopeptide (TPR) repeat protein